MPNIQIENISTISVSFSLNENFKPTEKVEFSFSVTVSSSDHEEKKIVDVIVSTPDEDSAGNVPFFFSVTGRGVFLLSESVTDEEGDRLANINCPAIIFPYVREQIADLTRRSGFPPLHLPSVNFIKMHEEKK